MEANSSKLTSLLPSKDAKVMKDSSSLLMSVIRTLSATENNEERDREKARLEREFKRSDQRLEELVTAKSDSLLEAMQTFTTASNRIYEARARIAAVRVQLSSCKDLLLCKRDQLKNLWMEGVQHKQVLELLELIEKVKYSPEKIRTAMNHKQYLQAAQLLVEALEYLRSPLASVEALNHIAVDLNDLSEKLCKQLLTELSEYIYITSCRDVLQFKRVGSTRDVSPFQRATFGRGSNNRASDKDARQGSGSDSWRKKAQADQLKVKQLTLEVVTGSQATATSGQESTVATLTDSLVILHKVEEAMEFLKSQLHEEMQAIVTRTSQQVSDFAMTNSTEVTLLTPSNSDKPNNGSPVQELMKAVSEQFKLVAKAHALVLQAFKTSLKQKSLDETQSLYTINHVWFTAQNIVERLLSQYLDVGKTLSSNSSNAHLSQATSVDLNAQFAKRRPAKLKKSSLFRFEGSLHSISLEDYMKEQQQNEGAASSAIGKPSNYLVCAPAVTNITALYSPVMAFIEFIETEMTLTTGTPCPLRTFLDAVTKDVFLLQTQSSLSTQLEEATRTLDSWKAVTHPEELKKLGAFRPILQSTVIVQKSLKEVRSLLQQLPHLSEQILNLVHSQLQAYKETCDAAYRGLVQPDSEDKRVISANWVKDQDISRFLRCLPSWTALQVLRTHKTKGEADVQEVYEESPEEINQRSAKETEILTGNLGDAIIPVHEILAEPAQLRCLALLHESLEWLATYIQSTAQKITSSSPAADLGVKNMIQVAEAYQNLSDTCLLVLHLEVRVHCFYHLVPLGKAAQFWLSGETQETDPEIGRLSRDLVSLDEALTAFLQPRKAKYIFEGLSHLVASIFISSVQHIRRINENGIKKMCRNIFALQQTLTNITLAREPALDHARHYFELMTKTPDEILNHILERGPQYTELEYIQAFHLLHRSRSASSQNQLTTYMERLSEILGEVGVTV